MVNCPFLYGLFYLLPLSLGGAVKARKKEKDFKKHIQNICVLEQSLPLPGSLIICFVQLVGQYIEIAYENERPVIPRVLSLVVKTSRRY